MMRKLFAAFICALLIGGNLTAWHFEAQASRRSDERAENLMRQARAAIGGDDAVGAVKNLVWIGKTTRKIKLGDAEQTLSGKVETALELPNKLHKKVSLETDGAGQNSSDAVKKVFVKRTDVLINRSPDGDPARIKIGEGGELPETIKTRIAERQQSETARLMLGLLLKTPFDAAYFYVGEQNVEGATADVVEVKSENGFAAKLYLDKQSHLPLMMTYRTAKPFNVVMLKRGEAGAQNIEEAIKEATGDGRVKVFVRKKGETVQSDGNQETIKLSDVKLEEADFAVRFADYRAAGNLLLPHRLTTFVNEQPDEETTIESYEINAANLAERMPNEVRVFQKRN